MGLDVEYRSQIRLAKEGEGLDKYGEADYFNGYFTVYCLKGFEDRLDGLVDGGIYHSEQRHSFCAGSYHGYNFWRDALAKLAGYPVFSKGDNYVKYPYAASVWENPKPGTFMELINFPDNEGTIGPETSAKLAKDFAEFQGKVDDLDDLDFRAIYEKFRDAFQTAADGGCVIFR